MNYLIESFNVRLEDLEEVQNFLGDTYQNDDSYEFADNLRIAWVGSPEEIEHYEERRNNGCCGYFDEELKCKSGRIYQIGFNYGH
jgi:hypothetical protein